MGRCEGGRHVVEADEAALLLPLPSLDGGAHDALEELFELGGRKLAVL